MAHACGGPRWHIGHPRWHIDGEADRRDGGNGIYALGQVGVGHNFSLPHLERWQ